MAVIVSFKGKTPDVSKAAFLAENAVICGDVILGEGASVWYGAVIRGDAGPIRIGRFSNIQDNCVLHCEIGGGMEIGDQVTVGHGAILHGCKVGDGCMIGMGAIVMNQAEIGAGSMVGAGALVTQGKCFPEGSQIVGSPARAVKSYTREESLRLLHRAEEYIELSAEYRKH